MSNSNHPQTPTSSEFKIATSKGRADAFSRGKPWLSGGTKSPTNTQPEEQEALEGALLAFPCTQNCLQIAKTRGIEASVWALRIPINLGLHCLPRLTAANAEGARQAREYIGRETNLAALAANAVCEFSCSRTTSQTLQETYTKVLKLGSGKTDREQDATTVYKSRLHSSWYQCEIVIRQLPAAISISTFLSLYALP
jgi:hypothetical protein